MIHRFHPFDDYQETHSVPDEVAPVVDDMDYALDDGTVTLFPTDLATDDELMSNWISVDEQTAIPEGEWR